MKTLLCCLLAASIILAGCSSGGQVIPQTSSQPSEPESSASDMPQSTKSRVESKGEEASADEISVDKGLFDVELTIPASYLDEKFSEEVTKEDSDNGIKSKKINYDGSATVVIGKAEYNELMKEMDKSVKDFIDAIPNDYESIVDAELNDEKTEAMLTVNRVEYEEGLDGFAAFGIFLLVGYYHSFAGTPEDDIILTINIQDADTSEIFDTIVYPDNMNS